MITQTVTEQNFLQSSVTVGSANCDRETPSFSDRLKLIIKSESLRSYAKKIDVSDGALRAYLAGTSEPSMRILIALAKEGDVNIDWLATGEGEMRPSSNKAQQDHHLSSSFFMNVPDDKQNPANGDEFTIIPVYDVYDPAGYRSQEESWLQHGYLAFRRDWLKNKGLEAKHLTIIAAKGDSMEPTISDGDIMLVDISIDRVIDDAIYIIQASRYLAVKRIQLTPDGSLTIISDNQRYEKQTISPEQAKEVKIAGRVRWYGHEI